VTLYLDHETELIARGLLAPPIVCTSYAWDDGPVQVELWDPNWARDALRSDPLIVGANTTYDLTCQMAADPTLIPLVVDAYSEGRVRDVQLDAKLLAIAAGTLRDGQSFSLETLAAERGIVLEKNKWRLRYGALRGVPIAYWPEGAVQYSADDTRATRAVHLANESSAVEWQQAGLTILGRHAALASGAAWALHLASCWGVCTDPKRVAELSDRVHAHLDEIRDELIGAGLLVGGVVKALPAHARMLQTMTEQGRRRAIELSDAGEKLVSALTAQGVDPDQAHEQAVTTIHRGRGLIKLDRDAAIVSGDELLVRRADYVSSSTLLGRVERMREGYTLPLQTRFDSLKKSFRTSSTQPGLPLIGEQMQNFPRGKKEDAYGLRETFTPRADDSRFIGADYAQAELYCLAQVCFKLFGWTEMGRLLNAGVDVHWYFAGKSIGLTIEQVRALPDGPQHRDRAKPLDFGIPGGMGPDKIILYSRQQYGVVFARDEVVELRRIWLDETFPEVREMFKWTNAQLDGRQHFTHVHPITGYVRGGCGYTDGNNQNFQHLAAYAAKTALVEVTAACFTPGSPLWGWRLWNFVHDELLLEGPCSGASAAAKELARIMSTCFNRFTPDFPTHADAFVTRMWSKKCKTVTDPVTGEILEWKPKS
jgi:DNA polymerase-1